MMINIIGNAIGAQRGGSSVNEAFEFTVDTTQAGTSAADQFTIPITSATPYNISTSDGHSITGATGSTTLTFSAPGTYTVKITESCDGWQFRYAGDRLKMLNISNWGVFRMDQTEAFHGAENMTCSAIDVPIYPATQLYYAFRLCRNFNGAIGNWDVSQVVNMQGAFYSCTVFNQDLDAWDVSNVTTMREMFYFAYAFNGNISTWDVTKLTSGLAVYRLLGRTNFNGDLSAWNVSTWTSMQSIFEYSPFNNNSISNWDVSNVTNFIGVFNQNPAFNQDISSWNTSSATSMASMFNGASSFNQPIGSWDVSNVTNMSSMFYNADAFNQDLSAWDVSNVISMGNMFQDRGNSPDSNLNISGWTTTSLNQTIAMFKGTGGNTQDLSGWDMSNVEFIQEMFAYGRINFNPSSWNISPSVMWNTFLFSASTAGNVDTWNFSGWDITGLTQSQNFLQGLTLSTANYDATLVAWENQLQTAYPGGVGYTPINSISFGGSKYSLGSAAEAARTSLISTFGWTITDGGGIAVPFTFTVDTTLGDGLAQFTIPTGGAVSNYDITTSDGQSITGNTADTTITFPSTGTYTIEITGTFPRINFNNTGDKLKLTNISKWGSIAWSTFNDAFYGCNNLTITATDVPNVSAVTDFFFAFHTCSSLSGSFDCSSWDLSSVNNIGYMFYKCQQLTDINLSSLNPAVSVYSDGVVADCSNLINITFPVSFKPTSVRYLAQLTPNLSTITNVEAWNTSAMTLCTFMFSESSFNQNIGSWDMSNVTDTQYMFQKASAFNQPIGSWNVGNVTNMKQMFNITSFNQDISSWDMSSVTSIDAMLGNNSAFNQPIGNWNTSNISNFGFALYNADAFDQSLANWNILNMTTAGQFMNLSTGLSTSNYDATLVSWEAQLQAAYPGGVGYTPVISIHFGGSQYTLGSAAETARTNLINTYGWTITDGGGIAAPFAFTVDTTIAGSSGVGNFQLPLVSSSTVNATVDWGDGTVNTVTAYNDPNATHTYSTPGTYDIKIDGAINGWSFNGIPEALKMTNVSSVGSLTINVSRAFSGCSNMTWTATDAPAAITGDLYQMFRNCTVFNGAIGNWDMSNVTGNGFWYMFENASSFNQDISGWDVSGITRFRQMFRFATSFNNGGAALTWNMSSANDVYEMFYGATNFNADISSWVFPNVTSLRRLLFGCSSFNQDISGWNVSSITSMEEMFIGASAFNQDISSWNVGNVTNMTSMFLNATSYNQPIAAWNTSNVTTMARMFEGATSFNQNIESLNTTSLTNISSLFKSTLYNQPLGLLNTSNITTISNIFEFNSAFNQDISTWNMSSLQSMRQAFKGATSFNQPIGNWNITSSLTDMYDTFSGASSFDNQNLNGWDTSNVTTMFNLFVFTTPNLNVDFDQWDVSSVSTFGFAFKQTGTIVNYDAVLVGWEASLQAAYPGGVGYPHTPSITFGSSQYTLGSAAEAARASLISTYGWTITDGGGIAPPYLLDTYTGAAAAYSLRDLSSSTTNVVRVRRSSDNTEQDFTSTQVIDGTLEAFIGAGNNGYVTIWYDQSGNNNHATQSNTAVQPIVVLNGVLVTEGGVPMIDYTTTQVTRLILTTPVAYSNSVYTFFGNGTKVSSNTSSFLGGITGSFQLRFGANTALTALRQNVAPLGDITLPNNTGHYAVSCRVNQTSPEFVANLTSGSGTFPGNFTNPIGAVGAWSNGTEDFEGKMGDWILYDTDQWTNQAAIQANINSYYTIY